MDKHFLSIGELQLSWKLLQVIDALEMFWNNFICRKELEKNKISSYRE
jgi:hypothetical protein